MDLLQTQRAVGMELGMELRVLEGDLLCDKEGVVDGKQSTAAHLRRHRKRVRLSP
jgi:hypothetical protein